MQGQRNSEISLLCSQEEWMRCGPSRHGMVLSKIDQFKLPKIASHPSAKGNAKGWMRPGKKRWSAEIMIKRIYKVRRLPLKRTPQASLSFSVTHLCRFTSDFQSVHLFVCLSIQRSVQLYYYFYHYYHNYHYKYYSFSLFLDHWSLIIVTNSLQTSNPGSLILYHCF